LRGKKEIGGIYWDATFFLINAIQIALGLDIIKAIIMIHVGFKGVYALHAQMAI
tara:strand:+ start:163 stop:324 length:162 start_codon:yes stop_codon:yes gene_type:complete